MAGAFLKKEDFPGEKYFPLEIYFCSDCKLVQQLYLIDPEVLYKEYFYLSSATQTAVNHFRQYAKDMNEYLPKGSFIVEMGSNDGVLLAPLKESGFEVLGVEPAGNISAIAAQKGLETINDFFNSRTAQSIKEKHGQADAILANNVFAHIDDVDEIIRSIKILLKSSGIFVFEVHYLLDLIEKLQYDTIYHEHFSYYSVTALINYFKKFDMEVFDVKKLPVHAGSIRVYVRNKSNKEISKNVHDAVEEELRAGLDRVETYLDFAKKVAEHKTALRKLLADIKHQGGTIAGYGAPGRGNTMLNYCEIGTDMLDYCVDESPLRQGRYIPGVHIPIFSPAKMREKMPTHSLMLAWSYKDEILKRESELVRKGCKFIIPLPEIEII